MRGRTSPGAIHCVDEWATKKASLDPILWMRVQEGPAYSPTEGAHCLSFFLHLFEVTNREIHMETSTLISFFLPSFSRSSLRVCRVSTLA